MTGEAAPLLVDFLDRGIIRVLDAMFWATPFIATVRRSSGVPVQVGLWATPKVASSQPIAARTYFGLRPPFDPSSVRGDAAGCARRFRSVTRFVRRLTRSPLS